MTELSIITICVVTVVQIIFNYYLFNKIDRLETGFKTSLDAMEGLSKAVRILAEFEKDKLKDLE